MSVNEVAIEKAQFKDSQKLHSLGRKTFYESFGPPINTEENIQLYLNDEFTLARITKELQNPNSEFYFAKLKTTIVGYLKINFSTAQTEYLGDICAEVERIYVVKNYQDKKIGQALLNKALIIAKEKDLQFVWLGVWEKNVKAIKFYKKNGFEAFDQHQFLLGKDVQTDIMMKCML